MLMDHKKGKLRETVGKKCMIYLLYFELIVNVYMILWLGT